MNLRASDRGATSSTFLHRLDARSKILVSVALLVAVVSTPPERIESLWGYLALLVSLALAGRVSPASLVRKSMVALPVIVAGGLFIPLTRLWAHPDDPTVDLVLLHVSAPGLMMALNVVAKAGLGLLCALLLTSLTPIPELLEGLKRLRLPATVVTLVAFTHRFAFVLADEALRMKRARDARCYGGRWLWQGTVVGHMVGTLFLRAHDRSERIYQAMLARGFTGVPHSPVAAPFPARDAAFMAGGVALVLLLRFSPL